MDHVPPSTYQSQVQEDPCCPERLSAHLLYKPQYPGAAVQQNTSRPERSLSQQCHTLQKSEECRMKIAVISMIRESWGGSEELWFAMAKRAIAEGHMVMHMSFDFDQLHPRMAELQQMGVLLFQRP